MLPGLHWLLESASWAVTFTPVSPRARNTGSSLVIATEEILASSVVCEYILHIAYQNHPELGYCRCGVHRGFWLLVTAGSSAVR